MTPELRHCFSITIQVDKPIIVSRSPQTGKRQLIPIVGGSVSGQLRGHVLPGGVDSQIIEPDGTCRLSARYALQVAEGTVYVETMASAGCRPSIMTSFSPTICAFLAIFRLKPSIFAPCPPLRWMLPRSAG